MRPREVSAKNRGPALLLSAWIVHVAIVLGLRFVMNWAYDDVPPLDESWVVPATQFILLGASTVQVCTGVMIHGYAMVKDLCEQLSGFMDKHGFESIEDFRGASLLYFTTHASLVERQQDKKAAERAAKSGMVTKDTAWEGDKFVEQSQKLVANQDED